MAEIERMFRVAAEGNASAHIHMRNGVAGLDSTIAAAAAAKAKLHNVHVNSSPYVIVMGQVVVDSGRVATARPGRAIRAPINAP